MRNKPSRMDSNRDTLPAEWTPEQDDEGEGLALLRYWQTIRRHQWGIFSITLMCVILGLLNAFSSTPIYRAEAKLLVSPIQQNSPLDQQTNTSLIYLFYETQFEILHSHAVAGLAVDKLNLVEQGLADLDQAAPEPPVPELKKTPLERFSSSLRGLKEQLHWRHWLPASWGFTEREAPPDAATLREQYIAEIRRELDVKGGKQSEIINLSFEAPNPRYAAAVTNALADAYIEFGLTSRLSGAQKTSSWLNGQLAQLRTKVKQSELALQAYQQQSGMVDTSNQQKLASEQLSSLTAELIKAQTLRSQTRIRLDQVSGLKGNSDKGQPSSTMLENPTLRNLSEEVNTLARREQELAERYGEKHPKMIAAKADLREARRSLLLEVDKTIEGIRKEYAAAVSQETKIQALIDQQKKQISGLSGAGFELAQLERELENNRRMYDSFLEKFKEADVAEEYDATNVRVVDPARVPKIPYKPNKLRMLLIAGLIGLLLGILFALLREHLDNTFRTTDNLEEKLDLPSLGIVTLVDRKDKAHPPHLQYLHNPRSAFAENINNIRTGLLLSDIDQPPKTILITSAAGGEGKTTLSINLAAAFAQLGRTLLIEADLRKPNLALKLGSNPRPGIKELLSGEAQLQECIFDKGPLSVLTCGASPENPLELLSSRGFGQLLDNLAKEFRHIILDAPPLLAVSDAAVLGRLTDSVVLAVKADTTTHQMAREALARLRKAGIEPIGAVLCQTDLKRMAYYGSHYYHYDSNYYGYSGKESSAA